MKQKTAKGQMTLKFKRYAKRLTVEVNSKGVMDIDTVKGCSLGMKARPITGCYGSCYAAKLASLYGYDFPVSVSRKIIPEEMAMIERKVMALKRPRPQTVFGRITIKSCIIFFRVTHFCVSGYFSQNVFQTDYLSGFGIAAFTER